MPEIKFDLSQEYALMSEQGKQSLRKNGVLADPLLQPIEQDRRTGLGWFFWHNKVTQATQSFLQTLDQNFPDQILLYGFPSSPAQQHITLLELAATQDNYLDSYEELEKHFLEVCEPVIRELRPIKARFEGYVVNSSGIFLKGYPENDSYNQIRDQLRKAIREANLPPLARRNVQIFHTTVARFTQQIQDVEKLVRIVDDHNNTFIGEDTFSQLHLIRASWPMATTQITNLANIDLTTNLP